jgi:hypothetical protein
MCTMNLNKDPFSVPIYNVSHYKTRFLYEKEVHWRLFDMLLNLVMIDKGWVLSTVGAVNLTVYFIAIFTTNHK